ncbi:hypothetical protein EX30DRAFT_393429 [Ascodesmis nigricans]|uniref:Uncharacterized protein n=1 Tax=Ascodesmis nigricans TaxID=341454 RepID=A0A4S2N3P5_9PEZI|nr:hypothetical protein EX30DRAFT_393429 [Ascodesmis nigricans]
MLYAALILTLFLGLHPAAPTSETSPSAQPNPHFMAHKDIFRLETMDPVLPPLSSKLLTPIWTTLGFYTHTIKSQRGPAKREGVSAHKRVKMDEEVGDVGQGGQYTVLLSRHVEMRIQSSGRYGKNGGRRERHGRREWEGGCRRVSSSSPIRFHTAI